MKQLIIPNKVEIAGVDYEVADVPVVIIDGDAKYSGLASYMDTRIELLDSLNEQRRFEVFFHELLHAMLFEAGIREHDEDMVERLGKILYQVMKRNNFYSDLDGDVNG